MSFPKHREEGWWECVGADFMLEDLKMKPFQCTQYIVCVCVYKEAHVCVLLYTTKINIQKQVMHSRGSGGLGRHQRVAGDWKYLKYSVLMFSVLKDHFIFISLCLTKTKVNKFNFKNCINVLFVESTNTVTK